MPPKEGFLDPVDEAPAAAPAAEAPSEPEAAPEAPVVAEAAPEKPVKAERTKPEGFVPEAALKQARYEYDQLRQQNARTEANLQKFLDRFHAENEPKQEAAEPPDWTVDPIGRMQHEAARIAEIEARIGQNEQANQQKTAEQSVLEASVMDINQYVQENPPAQQALQYLAQLGAQHLRSQGMTDPAQISQSLNKWQVQLAVQARQMGVRPARLLHMMAEERGWKPETPQPAPNGADKPATDQARDPATGQFVAADAEKNQKIAEAQDRNLSLSSAPGAPVKKLDAREFAKLDEKEQWAYLDRNKRNREFDRNMGFR